MLSVALKKKKKIVRSARNQATPSQGCHLDMGFTVALLFAVVSSTAQADEPYPSLAALQRSIDELTVTLGRQQQLNEGQASVISSMLRRLDALARGSGASREGAPAAPEDSQVWALGPDDRRHLVSTQATRIDGTGIEAAVVLAGSVEARSINITGNLYVGGTLYWHGTAVNLLSPSLAPSMAPTVEPFHKTCRDLLDSNPATQSGV